MVLQKVFQEWQKKKKKANPWLLASALMAKGLPVQFYTNYFPL